MVSSLADVPLDLTVSPLCEQFVRDYPYNVQVELLQDRPCLNKNNNNKVRTLKRLTALTLILEMFTYRNIIFHLKITTTKLLKEIIQMKGIP